MADYSLYVEIAGDANGLTRELDKAEAAVNNFTSGLSSAGDSAVGFGSRVGSAFNSVLDVTDSVGNAFVSVGGALTQVGLLAAPVTASLTALGVASASTTVEFLKTYQAAMTTFTQFYGGADAARELYNSLYEIATASTFSQEAFLRSGQRLAAFGVEAQDVTRYMQVAADAISAFGGSADDLESLAAVFGKITSQGKITGREIQQLSLYGIDALSLLAQQFNVTREEAQKMVSDGLVTAEKGLDALSSALEDTANGYAGVAEQLKTGSIAGALDSTNSAFRSFALNLTGINPTIGATADQLEQADRRALQLANGIGAFNSILPRLASAFTGTTVGIGTFLDAIVGSTEVLNEAGEVIGYTGGLLTELGDIFTAFKNEADEIDLRPLKRSFKDLGNTFPWLGRLFDEFNKKFKVPDVTGWQDIQGVLQDIGGTLIKVAAAGAGLIVLGTALSTVGQLIISVGAIFRAFGGIVTAVGAAFSGIGAPILAVIGLVAAVAAGIKYLMDTNDEFRRSVIDAWNKIVEALTPIVDTLKQAFDDLVEGLSPLWRAFVDKLIPVIEQVIAAFADFIEQVSPVVSALIEDLVPVLIDVADFILTVVGAVLEFVGIIIEKFLPVIADIIEALEPLINDFLEKIAPVIEDITDTIKENLPQWKETFEETLDNIIANVQEFWPTLETAFALAFDTLALIFENGWLIIKNTFGIFALLLDGDIEGAVKLWTANFNEFWGNIGTYAEDNAPRIKGIFEGLWDHISFGFDLTTAGILVGWIGWLTKTWSNAKTKTAETGIVFDNWFDELKSNVGFFLDDYFALWEEKWGNIFGVIEDAVGNAWGWGKDLVQNIIDGIKSKIDDVRTAVGEVADTIAGFLHFTTPDVGALADFDTYMPHMMQQLADGMTDNLYKVQGAAATVASALATPLQATVGGGVEYANSSASVSSTSARATIPSGTDYTKNTLDVLMSLYDNLGDIISSNSPNLVLPVTREGQRWMNETNKRYGSVR